MTKLLLADDKIRQYQREGFLVLQKVLEGDQLAALREDCIRVWEHVKETFDPNATWLQNALVANIHHHSTKVREYYRAGALVDVAEQLIGPNIKGASSQLTFKMCGNTQTFGWHQDNGYGQLDPGNAVSALTALDDADEENGCLWIVPGSHLQGQIDVSDRLSPESKSAGLDLSIDIKGNIKPQPLPLCAGDAVLFHCHTLHQSKGNHSKTRDRRILFLRYADADAVEVYNDRRPRLGPLLRGSTRFPEVAEFEKPKEGS